MGYSTDFIGQFNLDKPLTKEHAEYLRAFSYTRRMKRNATIAIQIPDPKRQAVNLPIGKDAEFFVGIEEDFGQKEDPSIVDYNATPETQPELWCQWVPTSDNTGIEWDGAENFYSYVEWLRYIINNFLKPWGYCLNGKVEWQGENSDDRGFIDVKNNEVKKYVMSKILYKEE